MHAIIRSQLLGIDPHIARRVQRFSSSACTHYGRRKGSSAPTASPKSAPTASTTATRSPFAAPPNSVLAYVGPYAASLRQCKSVAFVFGACGCIAVPATLSLGNSEYTLAIMAGVASLSPSALLHALFRNNVTKIYVPGSTSIKTPAAVRVFNRDVLKLTFEKLSWRGVPLQSQVLSTQLFVQSETEKSIVWTTNSATTPPVSASTLSLASRSGSNPKAPASGSSQHSRKETYRVDKLMMLRNPSFAYVMDQIEHQSRLSHSKYIQSHDSANSSSSNSKNE